MDHKQSSIKQYIPMIIKYLFSAVLVIMVFFAYKSKKTLAFGLLELMLIMLFTNALLPKKEKLIRWINSIVMLLFNIQLIVFFFGGTYLSVIMLTNIPSISGLAGRMVLYVIAAIIVIAVSFFSVKHVPVRKVSDSTIIIAVLILELILTMLYGASASPAYGWYTLGKEAKEYRQMKATLNDQENVTGNFYQRGVRGFTDKPEGLADTPNIVLIMTEGLSQSIIDDERKIAPNIAEFQKKSLSFANYYNHTFATYRGIIGQLYSGYQLSNLDTNSLISLQSILEQEGYRTSFINTEPNNLDFTHYLEAMKFQTIVSDTSMDSGSVNTASDKEAYELLYDTIKKEYAQDEPFFTVIYTYGTHVTLDSNDQVFADGSNAFLNKFYNMDYQFGSFMEKFEKSDMAADTLMIFTTDHATYNEEEYAKSMPGGVSAATSCDRIPLSFYYQGMKAGVIDAGGRNSLDLAPTVLDYLDVSGANYFLGTSLFSKTQNDNTFDTVYYDGSRLLTTRNAVVEDINEEQEEIVMPLITKYLTAKTQTPEEP